MTSRVPAMTVLVDRYPELSETFVVNEVRALRRAGAHVTVEALAEPRHRAPGVEPPRAWELETTRERLAAMARLALRHPLRCAADLVARRRWRADERVLPLRALAPAALRVAEQSPVHLHAHFAAGAALAALRIARILGVPYSVTAHAFDIYQRPANLPEKLRSAAFATSGCEYTVRDLRRIEPAATVHEIVMGVDTGDFRRSSPHPEDAVVVAVGRLVEKKGFADLIAAVALMRDAGSAPAAVRIAGAGPLEARLAAQIAELRLDGIVTLAGAVDPDGVRALLEGAAVLCMPCVVAADGDRDSMPVVVKEALAMEVPVVATDEVGLPEVVRDAWGRLVPPHDPPALAGALTELLALTASERAAMGRAGRAHVAGHCDVDRETGRLLELIAGAARNVKTGG